MGLRRIGLDLGLGLGLGRLKRFRGVRPGVRYTSNVGLVVVTLHFRSIWFSIRSFTICAFSSIGSPRTMNSLLRLCAILQPAARSMDFTLQPNLPITAPTISSGTMTAVTARPGGIGGGDSDGVRSRTGALGRELCRFVVSESGGRSIRFASCRM